MTQESASGSAVAERVRAADIAVGGNSPVTAMLANSLKERKPLADDGALHDTVQDAVNAAGSFVFVPPGTFNESVTIDTEGLTLLGSGRATLIDGGTISDAIDVQSSNVHIENISAKTTAGAENSYSAVSSSSVTSGVSIESIYIPESDASGINFSDNSSSDLSISNVDIGPTDAQAIISSAIRTKVTASHVIGGTEVGTCITLTSSAQDSIISNCILEDSASDNVRADTDCIVIGNRVINAADNGIQTTGSDVIIANNRISDSTNAAINNAGSGTTLDGNLTGPSN